MMSLPAACTEDRNDDQYSIVHWVSVTLEHLLSLDENETNGEGIAISNHSKNHYSDDSIWWPCRLYKDYASFLEAHPQSDEGSSVDDSFNQPLCQHILTRRIMQNVLDRKQYKVAKLYGRPLQDCVEVVQAEKTVYCNNLTSTPQHREYHIQQSLYEHQTLLVYEFSRLSLAAWQKQLDPQFWTSNNRGGKDMYDSFHSSLDAVDNEISNLLEPQKQPMPKIDFYNFGNQKWQAFEQAIQSPALAILDTPDIEHDSEKTKAKDAIATVEAEVVVNGENNKVDDSVATIEAAVGHDGETNQANDSIATIEAAVGHNGEKNKANDATATTEAAVGHDGETNKAKVSIATIDAVEMQLVSKAHQQSVQDSTEKKTQGEAKNENQSTVLKSPPKSVRDVDMSTPKGIVAAASTEGVGTELSKDASRSTNKVANSPSSSQNNSNDEELEFHDGVASFLKTDAFEEVVHNLQFHLGWDFIDYQNETIWFPPGGDPNSEGSSKVKGQDYFNSAELISYLQSKYGWKGPQQSTPENKQQQVTTNTPTEPSIISDADGERKVVTRSFKCNEETSCLDTPKIAPRSHNRTRTADEAQLDQEQCLWSDSPCITGSPNGSTNGSYNISSGDESSLASTSKRIKKNELEFQSSEGDTPMLIPRTPSNNDARKADDAQLDQELRLWSDSLCITGTPNATANNSSGDERSLASTSKRIKKNNLEFQSPEEAAFYEFRSLIKKLQAKLKWKYHFGGLGGHVYILPGCRGERQGGTRHIDFFVEEQEVVEYCFRNNYYERRNELGL